MLCNFRILMLAECDRYLRSNLWVTQSKSNVFQLFSANASWDRKIEAFLNLVIASSQYWKPLGTIHLRRRQIFTVFWPLTPYCRQFFSTIPWKIWQIFDPSPLRHAGPIRSLWKKAKISITIPLHLFRTLE